MSSEIGFTIYFWSIARKFFEYMDEVTFRTETQVSGYFNKGIVREFQHVFGSLYPFSYNILGNGHSYLFMK